MITVQHKIKLCIWNWDTNHIHIYNIPILKLIINCSYIFYSPSWRLFSVPVKKMFLKTKSNIRTTKSLPLNDILENMFYHISQWNAIYLNLFYTHHKHFNLFLFLFSQFYLTWTFNIIPGNLKLNLRTSSIPLCRNNTAIALFYSRRTYFLLWSITI